VASAGTRRQALANLAAAMAAVPDEVQSGLSRKMVAHALGLVARVRHGVRSVEGVVRANGAEGWRRVAGQLRKVALAAQDAADVLELAAEYTRARRGRRM
jgi:hypothetical protein